MAKLVYRKDTIVPHNGKWYKFTEILEEITEKPIKITKEIIDLTKDEEESTPAQPTHQQPEPSRHS